LKAELLLELLVHLLLLMLLLLNLLLLVLLLLLLLLSLLLLEPLQLLLLLLVHVHARAHVGMVALLVARHGHLREIVVGITFIVDLIHHSFCLLLEKEVFRFLVAIIWLTLVLLSVCHSV